MINAPGQFPGVLTSTNEIDGLRSQLSIAVAVPVLEGREESSILIVIGAGQVITGADISRTVIV